VEYRWNHQAMPARTSSRLRLRPSGRRTSGEEAPVAIAAHDPHRDDLAKGQGRRGLFRPVPGGLPLLGRVDPVEAHAHGVALPEHRQRIAVGDADDLADELLGRPGACGPRGRGEKHRQEGEAAPSSTPHAVDSTPVLGGPGG
jgi:hypothetical protein